MTRWVLVWLLFALVAGDEGGGAGRFRCVLVSGRPVVIFSRAAKLGHSDPLAFRAVKGARSPFLYEEGACVSHNG